MHCLFKKKNRALSVQLCKPAVFFEACLGYLPHQTLLLLFEACQLQLGNVSGLNRQRPISSPSLFFISLQSSLSLKTEIFLTAFPVLVGFSFAFLSTPIHFVFSWSRPCVFTIQKVLRDPAGYCRSPPSPAPVSSFEVRIWGVEWVLHFSILHCPPSFHCLTFLILPSLDSSTEVISDRARHAPFEVEVENVGKKNILEVGKNNTRFL